MLQGFKSEIKPFLIVAAVAVVLAVAGILLLKGSGPPFTFTQAEHYLREITQNQWAI